MEGLEEENYDDSNGCTLWNKNYQSEINNSQEKYEVTVSKNLISEKRDVSTKNAEDFTVDLKKVKLEPLFETETVANMPLNGENNLFTNENLKEALAKEESNVKEEFIEQTEKDLPDIKRIIETQQKIDVSELKKNNENELLKIFKEERAFLNSFDLKIPLVGKKKFKHSKNPLSKRYDLAIERNKRRFEHMKKTGIDDDVLKAIEKEASMSEIEKKKRNLEDQCGNIHTACLVTEMCIKILEQLNNDPIEEKKIVRYLLRVFYSNINKTCLLYVPHLVHTICFIRGNDTYSKKLRLAADECYKKFLDMFSIPPDYTFETVYTLEMSKFLPKDFQKFENNPLNYKGMSK